MRLWTRANLADWQRAVRSRRVGSRPPKLGPSRRAGRSRNPPALHLAAPLAADQSTRLSSFRCLPLFRGERRSTHARRSAALSTPSTVGPVVSPAGLARCASESTAPLSGTSPGRSLFDWVHAGSPPTVYIHLSRRSGAKRWRRAYPRVSPSARPRGGSASGDIPGLQPRQPA